MTSSAAGRVAPLPGLPADEDGPMFAEPWQADAYALAIALRDADVFSPAEWTEALAAAIAAAQAAGDPDLGDTYYQHWVAALEHLCAAKLSLTAAAVDARQREWRVAYLNTPHGQPVELRREPRFGGPTEA